MVNFFLLHFYLIFGIDLGLALTSLLSEQNEAIHQRYDVIIQSVCETLNDIMKEDTDDNTNKYVEYVI